MVTLACWALLGVVAAAAPAPEPVPGALAGMRALPGDVGSGVGRRSEPAGMLVVANKQEHTASLLDAATGRVVATLPVGIGPHEAAASRDGRWAVAANYGDQTTVGSSLTVIDVATWRIIDTLSTPGLPYRIAFAPNGERVVVVSPMAGLIRIFDAVSRQEIAAIPALVEGAASAGPNASAGPVGIAVSADGAFAYVAMQQTDQVAVVDLERAVLVGRFAVGRGPDGIAVAPLGQ